jgi:hypothetical protein
MAWANPSNALVTVLETEQPPPVETWTKCADENGICTISGTATVRYGIEPQWVSKLVTNSIGCNNGVFGDPAIGLVKRCETTGTVIQPPPPVMQTCPDGSVIPITDICPALPPVTSACKPLNLSAGDPTPPREDMLCTATKTCHDYRIGLVPFVGDPVVEVGKQYYVVRGLLWYGLDDTKVVAWVPNAPGTPVYEAVGFPGWAGGTSGAYFNRSCFE